MFRGPAGLAALLKEGSRHYQGSEEALYRNIDAAKKLGEILKTCFGPTGMSKLINNFLDKRFLTSDANTIVMELEIQHPAAKMLCMAAQMQATEFGDGTNLTILLGSELLRNAETLLNEGIHISSILMGYQLGLEKTLELMDKQVVTTLASVKDRSELMKVIQPVMGTKIRNMESSLLGLVTDACLSVMPDNVLHFNTDNVRVNKLVGGSLDASFLVNGMVLTREPKTRCREKSDCKICVLANALETSGTEGTATVLITTTEQLASFTKSEEAEMETLIKGYHDAGVEALIVGGHISSLALHFLDKFDMLAIATPSKFDIKRFCRTLRVPALQRMAPPMAEEIGSAEYVGVQEYGSQLVTVVRGKDTKLSTVCLRGPTRTLLDEVERAIDDAVSLVKACTKDARFMPGGGAAETALSLQVENFGATLSGIEQYAVGKFGQSLMAVPKTLAENAGQNPMEALAQIQAAHKAERHKTAIDVSKISGTMVRECDEVLSATSDDWSTGGKYVVLDHYMTKRWSIRLAADAAITVLKVDQIIMSKPAGGPKLPNQGHWDAKDDNDPIS